MMNPALLILTGFGLSFIGSIPFGIINMTVAHTALRKGMAAALMVAAGAVLIEFFQVFVALKFTWLFTDGGSLESWLHYIAMVVFVLAGGYFLLFAKSRPPKGNEDQSQRLRNMFARGMFVSTLNVMAIPYWVFYGTWLTAHGWLSKENSAVLTFALGTVLGTFALLLCYALMGDRLMSNYEHFTRWANRFVGVVLLAMGAYELCQITGIL